MTGSVSRRAVLGAGLALAAGGCVQRPVVADAVLALRYAVRGQPDVPLQRATIANLPYATITAKIGRGPRSLLVLGRYEGAERYWMSADRALVVTRRGRVVRTAGFPENLRGTRGLGPDPVAGRLHVLAAPVRFTRILDLDGGGREAPLYGLPVDSVFEALGPRRLTILEIDFDTILVRERCAARTLNWRFENRYWVDPGDGFVWKSRQVIARSFPPIDIEVLKPPA